MDYPDKPGNDEYQEKHMIYFEDISVGDTDELPGRHISKEEIIAFATEYDPQPHHIDEEAAKHMLLGELVASGWHTACCLIRMIFDGAREPRAFLGSPGVEELRWRRPVTPGDTLRATSKVIEARLSKSKPGMGLTKTRFEVFNQDDVMVMTMEVWGMMACRDTASPKAGAPS